MKPRLPGFSLFSRLALLGGLGLGLLLSGFTPSRPAWAQAGGPEAGSAVAQLTGVETAAFPAITAYMQVHDAAGQPVAGLTGADFRLLENGTPVAGLSAAEENVGVQVVFVLDSTDAFKARDVNGVTRLEQIQQALTTYTQGGLRPGLDDVTILTSDGPVVEHADDPAQMAQAVAGYTSTFTGVADPFTLLNTAFDVATAGVGRPRFVLFLSNGLTRPDITGQVADIAARAAAAQVTLYTLYVGPAGGEATTAAANLQTLAEAGGGQRLLFTDAASLDPFYQVLADHNRQYRLSYRSTLAVTGQHQLAAGVTLPGGGATLLAGEFTFPLRIEAPTVALGSLPASLVRVAAVAGADPALADPATLAVPVTVDFPDGHVRTVPAVELVVDGVVVASAPVTNTATLTWPLAAYATSVNHVLEARLVDELGLTAASLPVTVTVSLQEPAVVVAPVVPVIDPTEVVNRPGWPLLALALTGVLLAGGVGLLAWWTLTRAQRARLAAASDDLGFDSTVPGAPVAPTPTQIGQAVTRPPSARSTPRPVRRVRAAPVANAAQGTAPLVLPPAPAAPRAPGWATRLPHVAMPNFRWPTRPVIVTVAPAFLEVVESGGGGAPQADIDLAGATLTLGRDGALAEAVFHDRSVSRLHARLVHENGVFRLYDAGSTSGTWINYTPIAAGAGPELKHGDLINLGRVQLRFKRRDASAAQNAAGARVVALAPNGAAPHSTGAPHPAVPAAHPPVNTNGAALEVTAAHLPLGANGVAGSNGAALGSANAQPSAEPAVHPPVGVNGAAQSAEKSE